ncbi:hypothetical protein G7046_g7592 [Stylonectria norvegica]|nr:hypothetical protein G7046_g7592 [Stylonectria norvegica]
MSTTSSRSSSHHSSSSSASSVSSTDVLGPLLDIIPINYPRGTYTGEGRARSRNHRTLPDVILNCPRQTYTGEGRARTRNHRPTVEPLRLSSRRMLSQRLPTIKESSQSFNSLTPSPLKFSGSQDDKEKSNLATCEKVSGPHADKADSKLATCEKVTMEKLMGEMNGLFKELDQGWKKMEK